MPAESLVQERRRLKLGVLASHPIQYQAPLFRALAQRCDLTVYYAHRQTPEAQAAAGFGVPFEWDVDLLASYSHTFLDNVAGKPDTGTFFGCDTPQIADEIDRRGFDAFLVMGWHLKCFWQAVHACRRRSVPVMVRGDSQLATQRSFIKRAIKALVYPWLLRRFDAFLYVGRRNREYLEHYGVPQARLFFAPHCVDVDAFSAAASRVDREAVRASWGLAQDDKALLFVSRMMPGKRGADLMEAARRLGFRGQKAVVILAGDGAQRGELERQARDLKVPAVFLGFQNQSQLASIYRAADVLVLPSMSETWGLVVNEALACGTPCVVSDACGCAPDMIKPGINGIVFPVTDPAGLADALAKVLGENLPSSKVKASAQSYSMDAAAAGILEAATQLAGGKQGATQ